MCEVSDARSALEENRRQIMNAENLATVGKLAAGVAHEIRNPLTAVKMWSFSIRKAVGHDPELDRECEIISEEITRLERIVCNFLEFSRPPAPKLEAQSVSSLIDKTLELFGHRIEEKKLRLVRNDAEHSAGQAERNNSSKYSSTCWITQSKRRPKRRDSDYDRYGVASQMIVRWWWCVFKIPAEECRKTSVSDLRTLLHHERRWHGARPVHRRPDHGKARRTPRAGIVNRAGNDVCSLDPDSPEGSP